ncbi:hypothetical protein [Pseudoruegeria sp. HB172150]|uniref:hypothetical protein n=1 Tax=Pseudoruegeria sp. HB172150 TaxID=2721164 RepID=UPI001555A398|nr:hypothetical protein [Pseudoruegeria sp. HB172150]
MSQRLTLAIAAIASFGIIFFFVDRASHPSVSGAFGVDPEATFSSVLTAVIAFVATLVGVLLGAIYRRLIAMQNDGRKSVSYRVLFRSVFRSIDFQIGLFGAPVVFGLLWQAISDLSIEAMLVIALQNGFASHAVLREVTPFRGNTE